MTLTAEQLAAGKRALEAKIADRFAREFGDSVTNWFLRFGVLKDRGGLELRYPKLKMQAVQRKMFAHYDQCLAAKLPCKQIVLKWRKGGASTGAQAMMYHRGRRFSGRAGALMGDISGTSDQVFEIYRRFAENDRFEWPDGRGTLQPGDRVNNLTDDIVLPNTSTYIKVTAASTNANRGGTIQQANSTETAYYPINPERDPLTGFLGSWSEHTESSLGILDSTSNGPFGKFYEYFQDERNGWHKIFCAWFEDEENALPFASVAEERDFQQTMMKHEIVQQERFSLRLEQLHWLRDKLLNKCGSSLEQLNKEYPPTPEDAFLKRSALRFNITVLESMERLAKAHSCERVSLTPQKDDRGQIVSATAVPDNAGDVHVFERPRYGCKYALTVDSCTGEDQQSRAQSANPDWHSAQVWRSEFLDAANGDWLPPKLAAHHFSRLEVGVMCEVAASMSAFYGRCIGVVEVNGCGLYPVKKLAELGVPMWERSRKPQPNVMINETSSGWFTNEVVRKTIIDNLAGLIERWSLQRPTFELWSPRVIQELRQFIRTHNGRDEAMPGEHDDDVLAAAIALYTVNSVATEMRPPERKKINFEKFLSREGWKTLSR